MTPGRENLPTSTCHLRGRILQAVQKTPGISLLQLLRGSECHCDHCRGLDWFLTLDDMVWKCDIAEVERVIAKEKRFFYFPGQLRG